jgi:maleate isomerase
MPDTTTRLGLVVPSSNTAAEPAAVAAIPENATAHTARMPLADVTVDSLDEMAADATAAAGRLADAAVDALAYACTTGSLLHGPEFAAGLEEDLGDVIDGPAVVTALSVIRALDALDASRVAVVTPYVEQLNERERSYLEDHDIEVVALDGRQLTDNTAIGALGPDDAVAQVEETVDPSAVDAVFISCTNYRAIPAIDRLEASLGRPVVTSNSATLWDLCRTVGLSTDRLPGELAKQ